MRGNNIQLNSSNQIQEVTKELTNTKVTLNEVKMVLKEDMGMRYRKIQRVPLHLNSD